MAFTANQFLPTPVPPIPEGEPRPFWSVMVPTYNREQYLRETLRSILEQDPGRDQMQLCVVDNATTTFDVQSMVQRLAGSRIEYVCHPTNIGGIRNINSCIVTSRGQWVHVLHDDDIVLPGFYRAYERAIARFPDAALIFCPIVRIDSRGVAVGLQSYGRSIDGLIPDFLLDQATGNRVPTPSVVIPRNVYERIGAYREDLAFVPDWELAFRAGKHGHVITLPLPYAAMRWHDGSDSNRLIKTAGQIIETKNLVDLLIGQLSPPQQMMVSKDKYSTVAHLCDLYAHILVVAGDRDGQIQQLKWALKLKPTRARLVALWRARTARLFGYRKNDLKNQIRRL